MFLCTGKRLASMRKNVLGFFNMLVAGSEKNSRKGVQNYEIQCDTHEKTGSKISL